jgi:hypothetical protein
MTLSMPIPLSSDNVFGLLIFVRAIHRSVLSLHFHLRDWAKTTEKLYKNKQFILQVI